MRGAAADRVPLPVDPGGALRARVGLPLVIVDSRPASSSPLRELLDAVAVLGASAVLAPSREAALAAAPTDPVAALVHVGLDATANEGGAGPSVVLDLLRRVPDLPILLYTGNPEAPADVWRANWRLGPWTMKDGALSRRLAKLLPLVIETRGAVRRLRASCLDLGAECPTRPMALPARFAVDSFVPAVRDALVVAALRAHASLAVGASALGVAERTYRNWVGYLPLPQRSSTAIDLGQTPAVLWVSRALPEAALGRQVEEAGARLVSVQPGVVHPAVFDDPRLLAAIVDAQTVPAAIDAWVLDSSMRVLPYVVCGSASTPLSLLLGRLGLRLPPVATSDLGRVVPALLAAGSAASSLAAESTDCRCPRAATSPAWSQRAAKLLWEVEADILLLAESICPTKQAAARAVGLPFRTYYHRLAAIRRGR